MFLFILLLPLPRVAFCVGRLEIMFIAFRKSSGSRRSRNGVGVGEGGGGGALARRVNKRNEEVTEGVLGTESINWKKITLSGKTDRQTNQPNNDGYSRRSCSNLTDHGRHATVKRCIIFFSKAASPGGALY